MKSVFFVACALLADGGLSFLAPNSLSQAQIGFSSLRSKSPSQLNAATPWSHMERQEVKEIMLDWADQWGQGSHTRVLVSRSRTFPQLMVDFWAAMTQCMDIKIAKDFEEERHFYGHLLFVAPYCSLLTDPAVMSHLDKLLDFCQGGDCLGFGPVIDLTTHHPKGAAPHGSSTPVPFPVFALHIMQSEVPKETPPVLPKDEQIRLSLEIRLHSPAASSSADTVVPAAQRGYLGLKSPPTADTVLAQTKAWAMGLMQAEAPGPQGDIEKNLATVFQYSVSGSHQAEKVYSDAWNVVNDLLAKVRKSEGAKSAGVSAILVVPLFNSFNAEGFTRFALTFNTVLQQSPIRHLIKVDYYHPELVADTNTVGCRSPFPTLHLIYAGPKEPGPINYENDKESTQAGEEAAPQQV